MISCCSSKQNGGNNSKHRNWFHSKQTFPDVSKELITKFKREEKTNPPRSVWQYSYNGKTVYYVPAICCDFSDLYDDHCNLVAHPDGGFTGRGVASPKILQLRSNEKLIWKDKR